MSGLISEETLEKIPSLIALLRGRIEDENVRCDDDDAGTALALAEDLLGEVKRLQYNVTVGRMTCDISKDLREWTSGDPVFGKLLIEAADKLDDLITLLAKAETARDEHQAEAERLTAHSRDLNTIGFAAATALGLVPPGTEEILGDPVELVEMLIKQHGEANSARVEHAILMSGGSMQVRPDYPEIERIYPLDVWIEHNSRHGGKVFRRKVIVVEEWTEVTARQAEES